MCCTADSSRELIFAIWNHAIARIIFQQKKISIQWVEHLDFFIFFFFFFSYCIISKETRIFAPKFFTFTKPAMFSYETNLCKYTVYKYFDLGVTLRVTRREKELKRKRQCRKKKRIGKTFVKMYIYMYIYIHILPLRGYKSKEKIVATLPDSRIRVS